MNAIFVIIPFPIFVDTNNIFHIETRYFLHKILICSDVCVLFNRMIFMNAATRCIYQTELHIVVNRKDRMPGFADHRNYGVVIGNEHCSVKIESTYSSSLIFNRRTIGWPHLNITHTYGRGVGQSPIQTLQVF